MISFSSAMEWDNKGYYNEETKTITIENVLGLGDVIGGAQLNTPQNYHVPAGYGKIAEFDLWANQDYNDIIKNLNLYDRSFEDWEDHKMNRDYDIKYKTTKMIQETIYKESCILNIINQTENCVMIPNGTIDKEVEDWKELTLANLKENERITVGIFTEVEIGDHGEWILELYGVPVQQWASWTEDLNVNITNYYKLDESSGPVIDSVGNSNGTNSGATPNVAGKINTAYSFDGASDSIDTNDGATGGDDLDFLTSDDFSICAWVNTNDLTQSSNIIIGKRDGVGFQYVFRISSTSNLNLLTTGGSVSSSSNVIEEDIFYFACVTRANGGNTILYVNGSSEGSGSSTSISHVDTNVFIGNDERLESGQGFNGTIDEVGIWSRVLTPTEVTQLYNSGTGITFIRPGITLNAPANNFIEIPETPIIFNITSTMTGLNNASLFINGTLNETISISGTENTTIFTKSFSILGGYNWSAEACDISGSCVLSSTRNFTINFFKVNNITFNSTSFETAEEVFVINVSGATSAVLTYNGTEYATTKSGDIFTSTLQMVAGELGNHSFFWTFDGTGTSQTSYQNISETVFVLCNATYPTLFLNISFKDEADSSVINASIPTSTFVYYLGSGTSNKTLTFINNTDNFNYEFCATPNRTLKIDSFLQYKQGTAYPQRVADPSVIEYTNTTTNTTLYLLGVSDGLFVTFQVVNSAEQTISGVLITAIRSISAEDQVVGVGTTASSGSVTLWLNPDFIHDFLFNKSGLPNFLTSFAPTQSSYTIIMGTGNVVQNSTIRGIDYSILPINNFLENDTSYTFGFNLTSSFWDVSQYGFDLRLSNGTIITGGTSAVSGTPLTTSYDVNNQSIIYLDAFWLIGGNYTNITRTWIIQNTAYSGWSIKTFFVDLNIYLDSGLFGLDNFGRYLIAFIIIFISVGIMGQKFGISSPLGTISLMFGIILFFDVVTGILPDIRGISNLPTFLAGLILALAILNEVQSR